MFLEFDLAGAEWVVVAYLCRDENMLNVVRSGKSPHIVTGALMSGLSEAVVSAEEALNKKTTDPDEIAANRKKLELTGSTFLPRTMSIRSCGKKSNHACNYHIGYKTFALTNEMEEREAKKIVELYSSVAYPKLRDWWAETDEKIRHGRTLTNCFQRRVYLMGQLNDDLFKQGYAFVPQSTVVDSCNQAMVRMFEDETPDFRPSQLLAQVHDSLLTQYLSTDFAAMARYAIKLGRDYMRPTLHYGEDFRLNTDLKVGQSWGRLREVKLTDDADALADKLREEWELLHEPREAA